MKKPKNTITSRTRQTGLWSGGKSKMTNLRKAEIEEEKNYP
jgi:hypothetical protein